MLKDIFLALKSAAYFVFLLRKQAVQEMDESRRSLYLSLIVASTCSVGLTLLKEYWQPDPDFPFLSDLGGWLSLTIFELFMFFAGIVILTICTHLLGFQQHLTKLIVTGNWVGIILNLISFIPLIFLDDWLDAMLATNMMIYLIVVLLVLVPIFCIDIYRYVIVTDVRVRRCVLLWACQFFGIIAFYLFCYSILLNALF